MNDNELQHWGVKGQKWGVRRYQNTDGSLTLAGRYHQYKTRKKRKAAMKKAAETKAANKAAAEQRAKDLAEGKIKAKDMTNEELTARKQRLQLEKDYNDLMKQTRQIDRGTRFLNKVLDSTQDKIADQVVADIAAQTVKTAGVKFVNKLIKESGLSDTDEVFTNNKKK